MEFGDSLRAVEDREGWKGVVATSSIVPRRPPRLRDSDEMRSNTLHKGQEIVGNYKFCASYSRKVTGILILMT